MCSVLENVVFDLTISSELISEDLLFFYSDRRGYLGGGRINFGGGLTTYDLYSTSNHPLTLYP